VRRCLLLMHMLAGLCVHFVVVVLLACGRVQYLSCWVLRSLNAESGVMPVGVSVRDYLVESVDTCWILCAWPCDGSTNDRNEPLYGAVDINLPSFLMAALH
jgi:hypothetical protein